MLMWQSRIVFHNLIFFMALRLWWRFEGSLLLFFRLASMEKKLAEFRARRRAEKSKMSEADLQSRQQSADVHDEQPQKTDDTSAYHSQEDVTGVEVRKLSVKNLTPVVSGFCSSDHLDFIFIWFCHENKQTNMFFCNIPDFRSNFLLVEKS